MQYDDCICVGWGKAGQVSNSNSVSMVMIRFNEITYEKSIISPQQIIADDSPQISHEKSGIK